ncbi:glycosyltransferase [Dysgonomonas sp. 520]|uniref:glycosyltransferase n=1 Tax=Dysgonomonas sp. 520 TaxID=2302931 RepID=UPI002106CB78|nr:glycosyltransferase [Dysgonomonas sp. 520]NDW09801.1 glycosyltransferase [Dysgonomonas sp. 520]
MISFFKKIFSIQNWIIFIHKKRIKPLIYILNKLVRKQKKNPLSIPVIIINYNRLKGLKQLVTFLIERKHQNIIIIDNDSSYPPLLEYYEHIKDKVTIERLNKNWGHLVLWKNNDLLLRYTKGYYIVTDSDILPNDKLPVDYVSQLMNILNENDEVVKVGFALDISDIPESYALKDKVLDWEKQYWEKPIGKDLYLANLDTTFAIYPPLYRFDHISKFFSGIRVAGNFTAKHEGWYVDSNNMTEEELYYKNTANSSNNW